MTTGLEEKLDRFFSEVRAWREEAAGLLKYSVKLEKAAAALDVSVPTLRRMIRSGKILSVQIGNVQQIPTSELRRITTPAIATPKTAAPPKKRQRASTAKSEAEAIRAALKKR